MRPLVALFLAVILASALRAETAEPVLTLDDAIRQALANNRALKVESYNPGIAHANWLSAVGQFDPALTFNRSITQEQEPVSFGVPLLDQTKINSYSVGVQGQAPWGLTYSVGGNATSEKDVYGAFAPYYNTFGGVQVTQHLLNGFGPDVSLAGIRIAKANRGIAEWDYRQAAMQTVANVAFNYSALLQAHDQLRIAHKFQDLTNTSVSDMEKSYKIGARSKSDVIQAQAQAASQEESVLVADQGVRDAENALRLLMGQDSFPLGRPMYAVDPLGWPDDIAVRPQEDYQTALRLRPDYQAARLGVKAMHFADAAARNGLLPQVDFVGGYGYNGISGNFSAARQMAGDRLSPSYSAGLQVTIPFTFAQARGKARAARLQLQQSEEGVRMLEANIALGLATAGAQVEVTRLRVAADRAAYDCANQALAAQVKKLHAGQSDILFVLSLQESLAAAENSVSNALAAERLAATNYEFQVGSILQRHHITLAEP